MKQGPSSVYTEDASIHSPPPLCVIMPEDAVKTKSCDLQTHGKAEISRGDRQLNLFINLIHSNYKVLNVRVKGGGCEQSKAGM